MNATQIKTTLIKQHYEQNFDSLVKRAKRSVGEFWAEDCVNDAYEQLFTYINRLPLDYVELNPYINTVVNNVIKKYRADRIGYMDIEENMLVSEDLEQNEEDKARVKQILDSLSTYPSDDRGVIYSVLFQGMKYDTVAKVFNEPFWRVQYLVNKFRKGIANV